MLESVFTNKSNVKTRIQTAIDEVLPGLVTIYRNCKSRKWDRYKLKEFWAAVKDEEKSDDEGELRKGNRFGPKVSQLCHFLSVASNKRSRSAFSNDELAAINELNTQLKTFRSLCNKATSDLSIKNDVSFAQIVGQLVPIIEGCKKMKTLVTSDRFTEAYISEALFITKRNIDKELYSQIKVTLGILNNTENSFPDLMNAFKSESKKLNKLLTKALRYDSVYGPNELQQLSLLNDTLLDLSSSIRINNLNDAYTTKVKSLIKTYVKRCKLVSSFIEKRLGIDTTKNETVKEADESTSDIVESIPTDAPEMNNAVNDVNNAASEANTSASAPTAEPVNDTSDVSAETECGDNSTATDVVSAQFEEFMNMF